MAEIQPHVSAAAAERRQSASRVTSRSAGFTWPRNLASVGDSASPRAVTGPHQGTAGEVVQGQPQQGINEAAAAAIARVCYHDRQFKRRLDTTWDNLGQGQVLLRGPATRLIVHMLVGYDPQKRWSGCRTDASGGRCSATASSFPGRSSGGSEGAGTPSGPTSHRPCILALV